jgi:hypothetical protein
VLAEEGVLVSGDTECVFEFGPTGQDLPKLERQFDGEGGVAAGTADGLGKGGFRFQGFRFQVGIPNLKL